MKKLLITICILFVNLGLYAQKITFADLKYVLYHSIGEVEDRLSEKKIDFNYIDTIDAKAAAVTYEFENTPKQSNDLLTVGKGAVQNIFYEASLTTRNQNDYLLIKSTIKQLGFTIYNSRTYKGKLITDYKKGNLIISFWMGTSNDMETRSFYIVLTDKTLSDEAYSKRTEVLQN